MPDTPDDSHARLVKYVHAAAKLAVRADHLALDRTGRRLAADGALDQASAEFLQQAPRTVIVLAAALHAILDLHRPWAGSPDPGAGCRECGTSKVAACRTLGRMADVLGAHQLDKLPCVDAAEAWRRAHPRRRPADRGEVVSTVTEIADAYVVRSMVIEPPPVPIRVEPSSERVLLVDKVTGQVVIWPLMPLPALERGYSRYRQGARTISLMPKPHSERDRCGAQPHRALAAKVAARLGRTLQFAWKRRRRDG
ncbi:hypothetical protein AB0L06_41840 [Spirillospora sp. NPDC052269]